MNNDSKYVTVVESLKVLMNGLRLNSHNKALVGGGQRAKLQRQQLLIISQLHALPCRAFASLTIFENNP